jgi:hypothetical protein
VLYPSLLRDVLIRLAIADVVELRWSDRVHDEWTRNLLLNRPGLTSDQLARTRRHMEAAVPDARVEGYEALIPELVLPDQGDRHVLAATLHAGAALLTFNLRDFPAAQARGTVVLHPDAALPPLIQAHPDAFRAVLSEMSQGLRTPPLSELDLAAGLRKAGLPQSALLLETLLID